MNIKQLTKEQFNLLNEHKAEVYFMQIKGGYLRQPSPELLNIMYHIYRNVYPQEIISNNCGSCTLEVVSKLGQLYDQYKKENDGMD